jgi:sugar phosphate isomerase/epimerase
VRKVLSLAYDLGPRLVIVQAGQVPEKEEEPEARRLREALSDLGSYAGRTGCVLALETGLESGAVLNNYLATFDTDGLGVNLDPANLLLNKFDPYQAIRDLTTRIRHTHARDGRKGSAGRAGREVPVGAGDIDWLRYLETLEEAEYRGPLIVEREEGENRLADMAAGVEFLRRIVR